MGQSDHGSGLNSQILHIFAKVLKIDHTDNFFLLGLLYSCSLYTSHVCYFSLSFVLCCVSGKILPMFS